MTDGTRSWKPLIRWTRIVTVLCALFLFVWKFNFHTAVKLDELRPGMSPSEVREVLGEPDKVRVYPDIFPYRENWIYEVLLAGWIDVQFDYGALSALGVEPSEHLSRPDAFK